MANDLNSDILGGGNFSSMLDSLNAINDAWRDSVTDNYRMFARLQKNFYDIEKKSLKEKLELELRDASISFEQRKKIVEQLAKLEKDRIQEAAKIQEAVDEKLYRQASFYDKKRLTENAINRAKEYKARLDQEIALAEELSKTNASELEHLKELNAERAELLEKEDKEKKRLEELNKIEYKRMSIQDKLASSKKKQQEAEEKYKKALLDLDLGIGTQEDIAKARAEVKGARSQTNLDQFKANLQQSLSSTISNAWKAVADGLNKIDQTIDTLYKNQGRLNARLYGTAETYQGMLKDVSTTIGLSPYVSQKAMVENITKAIDEGIAYNIEQRAFLATISENIASTFDAFDGNLMRLIRLQQADSTAARLGMEAVITQFLNAQFKDTSYLKSTYDTVSQALLEASSQLTRDESLALEFIAQKWIGSLSSLGLSEQTASTIATGLNLLGTGNVGALNSNSQLQTLLALSASRAGVSYADILTGGLTANTTNELLRSMVEYLKEISETNNQVVKSQYANLLGLSIADFRALQSLSSSDITNIYKSTLTYGQATGALNERMSTMKQRLSVGQMMDTLFENAVTGIAATIGGNVGSYAAWRVTDLIEKATGGINIPTVGALGNFVDLNATVTQLMKIGIAGMSTLASIGSIVSAFGKGSGLRDLSVWGGVDYNRVGAGLIGIKGNGFQLGSSEIAYVGSASSSDIYKDTILEQKERAKETQELISKETQEEKDIYNLIESAMKDGNNYIRVWVVNDSPIDVKWDSISYPPNDNVMS